MKKASSLLSDYNTTGGANHLKENAESSGIFKTPEKAIGPHFHAQHGYKSFHIFFYLLLQKHLGNRFFQPRFHYYQVAQCYLETPIPVSSRRYIKSDKAKKDINIQKQSSRRVLRKVF